MAPRSIVVLATDFDVVADHHTAGLGNLYPRAAAFTGKAKSVGTDNGTGMDDRPGADARA